MNEIFTKTIQKILKQDGWCAGVQYHNCPFSARYNEPNSGLMCNVKEYEPIDYEQLIWSLIIFNKEK